MDRDHQAHLDLRRVWRTGEAMIGGGMAFVTMALAGEAVGPVDIVSGTWRPSHLRSALCFQDLRSVSPRVMAEPEDLLDDAQK